MSAFQLHERLAADTVQVCDLAVSRVLLMNDGRYPWLILVPQRANAVELFDLSESDRTLLMREIAHCSEVLKSSTGAQKINVGALGNLVPQLHIHIVARNPGDAAWPGPVWGFGKAEAYAPAARDALVAKFSAALKS
jgi:diadenosine tetraphosphate (Ap4A) HIT family hydrolase